MKIYSSNGLIENIAIVPREFHSIDTNGDSLEIVSTAIERALKEAGLDFCPPAFAAYSLS